MRSRPDPPEAHGEEAHEDAGQDGPLPPSAEDPGELASVAHTSHALPASDDATPKSVQGRRGTGSDTADSAGGPETQEARPDGGSDPFDIASAPPPPGYPSDAVLSPSSSPTRSLKRFTAKVSLNDQTPRLGREARWLLKNAASFQIPSYEIPSSPGSQDALPRRRRRSMSRKPLSIAEEEQEQERQRQAENPEPTPRTGHSAPSAPTTSAFFAPGPAHVSFANAPPPRQDEPAPPGRKPPKTPLRRSILSLVPGDKSAAGAGADLDMDVDMDELGRSLAALPAALLTAGPTPRSTTARKRWKSSALTTEVYRTPVRTRPGGPASPDSVVRTPGGTLRVCGVDGYRCGRDFCFTCL
ncbi:hypothetical protein ESCO_000246 [Escovopsis weberi]|uniref:Uncharacterized protein n=1 Tax=Escovopsis weberi TaxID=150374 RepID=A0A0M8MXK1_ESCWE|nr:hypothetical protein ESCO_000246 [Escovopsis weberi]